VKSAAGKFEFGLAGLTNHTASLQQPRCRLRLTDDLKPFFGDMLPTEVGPHHVTDYLDIGLKTDRGVRANRERACLSSCMSWTLRNNHGDLKVNPCMRASGVQRNAETERDRYVTNEEYWAVYEAANRTVHLMMELVYHTLQRPEIDVLAWTPANVVKKAGKPVLRFIQSKTKRQIDIGLEGQLEQFAPSCRGR
jgi:hypothetical protein